MILIALFAALLLAFFALGVIVGREIGRNEPRIVLAARRPAGEVRP